MTVNGLLLQLTHKNPGTHPAAGMTSSKRMYMKEYSPHTLPPHKEPHSFHTFSAFKMMAHRLITNVAMMTITSYLSRIALMMQIEDNTITGLLLR